MQAELEAASARELAHLEASGANLDAAAARALANVATAERVNAAVRDLREATDGKVKEERGGAIARMEKLRQAALVDPGEKQPDFSAMKSEIIDLLGRHGRLEKRRKRADANVSLALQAMSNAIKETTALNSQQRLSTLNSQLSALNSGSRSDGDSSHR